MKQTQNVSIGGYAFTLENDALEAIQSYLDSLESHYLSQTGGKEIMEGIEERVAELLTERCGSGGVVTLSHVREVIDIVGKPESIEADDPAEEASSSGKTRRRLFRNLEEKQLGGVCSGLATYFDIEVSWLRIAFVVVSLLCLFWRSGDGVFNFIGPVIYCILWVAMPPARTAQDRWAMKGDSGRADDIRRNVQAGIHEMGDTARNAIRSTAGSRIGRILIVVIGLVLLITGTSGLASVSVLGLKGTTLFGEPYAQFLEELSEEAPVFLDMMNTDWIMILAALAVILPFVGLLYGGIRLIFGFKSPSWKPGLVVFVLWLIIVVVLAVLVTAGAVSNEMVSV